MKKKILVADDDAAIVDAIQLILEDAAYTVETTLNGEDVLKLEKDLPDLILLDIWMSGQDGRAICKQLKNDQNTRHIPIIIISANKDISQIAKAADADDYITKPFEMEELLKKVVKYAA